MPAERKKVKIFALVFILGTGSLCIFISFPFLAGFDPAYGNPVLEFPIKDPGNVTDMTAFNTPDWGEPGVFHNGIDLVIHGNNATMVISPCNGIVRKIDVKTNPYAGNMLLSILIKVNYKWSVKLVLEPMGNSSALNQEQQEKVLVEVGKKIMVGDDVAFLLDGDEYAHLHYMAMKQSKAICPYQYSSAIAQSIFDNIATVTGELPCL